MNSAQTPARRSGSPDDRTTLEALRKSEEKFRLLVENAPICIHEIDLEGRLTSMNPAGLEIMSVEKEGDVCGLRYLDAVCDADRERIAPLLQQALEGKPSFFDFRAETEHGLVHLDSCFIPIEDEDGAVVRLMGITQDITERERMQEEIRRSRNMESLGLLAGGIAHDFNNLLTGVLGNLSLLEDVVQADGEAKQLLEEAAAAARRTQSLTQQLLTFAKGGEPVKKLADVRSLVVDVSRSSTRGLHTEVEFDFEEDLPPVEVDRDQIGQVVQNLVLNAAQASAVGGKVKVGARAHEVRAGRQEALPLEPGNYVAVFVEDHGRGIDPDHLEQIFTPYFTTKEAGHGLGLAIVFSIVARHEGHVTVRSELKEGTRFEFYLPAVEEQKVEAAGDPKRGMREGLRGNGERILVLDDEEAVRRIVCKMLERLGYRCTSVARGEDALREHAAARASGEPFQALLFDLTIAGGMGGKETLATIRQSDPGVRAIVSSGYSNDPALADPAAFGFADRLAKPVTFEALGEVVATVLAPKAP